MVRRGCFFCLRLKACQNVGVVDIGRLAGSVAERLHRSEERLRRRLRYRSSCRLRRRSGSITGAVAGSVAGAAPLSLYTKVSNCQNIAATDPAELVRSGNDLVLRRISSPELLLQPQRCNVTHPRFACNLPCSLTSARQLFFCRRCVEVRLREFLRKLCWVHNCNIVGVGNPCAYHSFLCRHLW